MDYKLMMNYRTTKTKKIYNDKIIHYITEFDSLYKDFLGKGDEFQLAESIKSFENITKILLNNDLLNIYNEDSYYLSDNEISCSVQLEKIKNTSSIFITILKSYVNERDKINIAVILYDRLLIICEDYIEALEKNERDKKN